MSLWTDEEISTLISMWPNASVMQIAARLDRSRRGIGEKVKSLRKKGFLLDFKKPPRNPSIKPDPRDFDKVKRDYRRKHHISIAQLSVRLERNGQLATELYRQALAAKLTRLPSRKEDNRPAEAEIGLAPP
jgi:hypothetical protein